MKINNKLIFGVFCPSDIPDLSDFFNIWNDLAKHNGLDGFFFFAYSKQKSKNNEFLQMGYDAVVSNLDWEYMFQKGSFVRGLSKISRNLLRIPKLIPYAKYVDICRETFNSDPQIIPCIEPNFDHSPRSGSKGLIFKDSTPKLWKKLCVDTFKERAVIPHEENIIFIKAWNEWGEGNYLEPDLQFGTQYLKALKEAFDSFPSKA